MTYLPSTLPEVDTVVIVSLGKIDRPASGNYIAASTGAPSVSLQDQAAVEIAELWRALPSGMQARCHLPPYGLKFQLRGARILEASICWKCNNIVGTLNGAPFHFEFDSEAPPSVELLDTLKRLLP